MPAGDGASPYVGLATYTTGEREYFFGREREASIVSSNLFAAPLTVLYGPGGVGKSSLLCAGVIPHLAASQRTAVVYFNQWRESSFADALKAGIAGSVNRHSLLPFESGLGRPLDALVEAASQHLGGSILVILDQFEDYLLYVRDSEAARAFDLQLSKAVSQRDVDAGFLIAIRDDVLSTLQDRFKSRMPVLRNTLRLRHMQPPDAERAIRGPLEVYNRERPGAAPVTIEDPLVRRILADTEIGKLLISDSAGAGLPEGVRLRGIETSFLQLVLSRLWEAETERGSNVLRLATLEELGGAGALVKDYVGGEMRLLSKEDQRACARMFHLMVMPSGAKIAQRTEDLAAEAARSVDAVAPILDGLARKRILYRSFPPERYEIGHDVLGPAVLDWRVNFQREEAIADSTRQAEIEKRNARRFRRLAIALAVMFVAAVTLGLLAYLRERQSRSRELAAAALNQLRLDPERGVLLALYGLQSSHTPEAEDALHRMVVASRVRRTIPTGQCAMAQMAVSRDATRMAAACEDGSFVVYESSGKLLQRVVAGSAALQTVAFSPDARRLATGGKDGAARIWDAVSGALLVTVAGNSAPIQSIAFSPDGTRLATGTAVGIASLWDARSAARLRDFEAGAELVRSVAFNPDGTRLLTADQDGALRMWNAATGKEERRFQNSAAALSATFSPDGRWVAAAIADRTIRLWDSETGELRNVFSGHSKFPSAVAFSPDATRLASAGFDETARIWNVRTGVEEIVLAGHTAATHSVAFAPDGESAFTGSLDHTIRTWDVGPAAERFARQSPFAFTSVAYSPDGNRLVASSTDRAAYIWDVTSGSEAAALSGHEGDVWQAVFSPDGQKIATAAKDYTARIWSAASAQQLLLLRHPAEWVHSVAFRPDGKALLTGNYDGHARLWNALDGTLLNDVDAHRDRIECVQFSPDGAWFATGSADRTAIIWDAQKAARVATLSHGAPVRALAFHPDGRRIATAGSDKRAVIWEIPSGRELLTLSGHPQDISAVTFDRSGNRLATGDAMGTIRIWSSRNGDKLLTLDAHQGAVTALAFSPDARFLASSGEEGAVRVFVANLDGLVALAHERVTRSLTAEECRQYLQASKCPELP